MRRAAPRPACARSAVARSGRGRFTAAAPSTVITSARPADDERELGAAAVAHPADEQRAERREAVPGVVVEAEHAAADVVRARELDRRVRVGGVAREEDAADEEQQRRRARSSGPARSAARRAPKPAAPMNITRQRALRHRGGRQRADERAGAEAGGDDRRTCAALRRASFFASSGSRMLKLKQIDEKTTIIARITEHGSVAARVREALARAAPERRAPPVDEREELAHAHREQACEHGEEADAC